VIIALNVSITGQAKTGKSHLALTFPEPIRVFLFDTKRALDPILSKFEGKEIDIKDYSLPIIESDPPKPYAKDLWQKFDAEYRETIEEGHYQTIVIDTATAVWEVTRHAVAEEVGQKRLLEVQYTLPNLRMAALFSRASLAGVNLVTTQYLRDRYVKGESTGEQELDGWKRTGSKVDLVLRTTRKTDVVARGEKKSKIITLIEDNRFDLDLNGQELDNATYEDLLALIGVE
jgi:hypothetical protein